MASTRLPGKPLADICGTPMIVHVWRRAVEARVGTVLVATPDAAIVDIIRKVGGHVVETGAELTSGSDRVAAALARVDAQKRFQTVINLQGDLPDISAHAIARCLEPLAEPAVDIATLAAPITDEDEKFDPGVVKAVLEADGANAIARARDFCRLMPPEHTGPQFHHIGIYAYRRTVIDMFTRLPRSQRETERQLEQMRALDAGMRIDVALVDTVPIGVDTPADLERARSIMDGTK